jgi:hypothetical protein
VKQNGNALVYIQNPDKEIQLAAVKQNGNALVHIQTPDKEIQLAAVKQDGYAICAIQTPDKEIQLAAVKQNGDVLLCIQNPDKEVELASKGLITVTNKPVGHSVSNKEISITLLSNEEVEITNYTKKYMNIKSLSQYYCGLVTTASDIRVPPEGIITKFFSSSECKVYSIDQKIDYGFAVEYTIGTKTDSIYKLKNFTLSQLVP